MIAAFLTVVSLITATQVAEPYMPALRGWVREYFEDSRTEIRIARDAQIQKIKEDLGLAVARTSLRLDLIDQGQLENRITTYDLMLNGLRSELVALQIRIKDAPGDTLAARRIIEIESQMNIVEAQRETVQCLLDRKRGSERNCQ